MHSLSALATNMLILAQTGKPNNGVKAENSWDLQSFLDNATGYMQTIGGSFLALLGICGVVWGGFLLIRKLMGGQSAQQDSWFKIVMLIIIGGVFLFTGMAILLNFAEGAKKTIDSFGNKKGGVIMPELLIQSYFPYLLNFIK